MDVGVCIGNQKTDYNYILGIYRGNNIHKKVVLQVLGGRAWLKSDPRVLTRSSIASHCCNRARLICQQAT